MEMVANEVYSLICEAKGSKPPAVITWWKDDKLMNVTQVSDLRIFVSMSVKRSPLCRYGVKPTLNKQYWIKFPIK